MSHQRHEFPICIPQPAEPERPSRFAHRAMACTWELYLWGEQCRYARQVAHAAFAEVDRLDRALSRFVAHSDIARLNALPAGRSVRVGIEALECLELAAGLYQDTHGAFDVTIGALLGPRGPTIDEPPPATAPGEAHPPTAVGMHLLEIRRATCSVTVHADGLVVDLGGLGKGYALDRAVAVLRDWSIAAALIHCGQSTVYALGRPPGQPGWTVAIRNPADHRGCLGSVSLGDGALSGSGTLLHGRHIIDPRSRRPAAGVLGAWTLAPSAVLADALSTTFMVLAPPEVADYCRRHPQVSGLLRVRTPQGHALRRCGRGFESVDVSGRND